MFKINNIELNKAILLAPMEDVLEGYNSIRINDQFRIIFRFELCDAFEVEIINYHQ